MPRGAHNGLRQVESYLSDTGMAGLASTWAMARRRPKEYSRVARWTRRRAAPAYAPIPDLTYVILIFLKNALHIRTVFHFSFRCGETHVDFKWGNTFYGEITLFQRIGTMY